MCVCVYCLQIYDVDSAEIQHLCYDNIIAKSNISSK